MKITAFILYALTLVTLTVATFLEHSRGTDFAAAHVYHAPWFCVLWALLALGLVVLMVKRRLWQRLPMLVLHGSFLVILAGALTSYLTSDKGYVHLVPGLSLQSYSTEPDGFEQKAFPFSLSLDSFRVRCYPGTDAPADYASYVSVTGRSGKAEHVKISMNNVFERDGYRLYQSSFDDDGAGSWLSVNYDPFGTHITYIGYLLFGLGALLTLFSRREEFLRLLRHPILRGGACVVALLMAVPAVAGNRSLPAFDRAKADSLASRQVIYNDRVAPFNTLARDFVLKVTGHPSWGGLTPEQVVSGWLLRPDAWQNEPMILVKSAELRRLLGIEGKYARLTDFFDGEEYVLNRYWEGGPADGAATGLQKAIAETDERVGLIEMLVKGQLIKPRPDDVAPLPKAKVRAELLYNRLPLTKFLFMLNLALGIVAFATLVAGERWRRRRLISNVVKAGLIVSTLLLTFLYILRWYISGHVPLSNGYETMLFMGLVGLFVALALQRRFAVMLPFGLLVSGFTLLVAHLSQSNPQITPLVPVLVSPWLSSHVSVVMLAYALLAFIFLNGVVGLCLRAQAERLMLLSRLLLYPAVFLLGAGIFLGAVWANQSWGSYWTWDPKEVWALITFMIYGIAFHKGMLPALSRPRAFHVFSVLAFLTVLMTYFGVNYLLGGMHSYAG